MFGSKKPNFETVFEDGFCHSWDEGKGGIGISRDKTQIALREKDKFKTYERDQVRNHQCVVVTGGVVYGGGMRGAGVNIGEAIRASGETGLFVRVKDIQDPVWRVPIKDVHMQNVWNEILQQWYDGEL